MTFRRPDRGWGGLISRGLAPLSAGQPWISYDKAEFAAARSYTWLAAVMFLAVATIVVLTAQLPVVGVSPVELVAVGAGDVAAELVAFALIDALLIFLVVRCVRLRTSPYALLCRLALFEELWFRAGAESWTRRQRMVSCVLFGVAHLANLIVTMITLGALTMVGGVFMIIYLREVRRTHDRRAALIVTAKLHATYNVLAFGFLALAGLAGTAVLIIDRFG